MFTLAVIVGLAKYVQWELKLADEAKAKASWRRICCMFRDDGGTAGGNCRHAAAPARLLGYQSTRLARQTQLS